MASKMKGQDRLDELATNVRRLLSAPIASERLMGELSEIGDASDGEDAPELVSARREAGMLVARLQRDQALIAYFEESERLRADQCSVHEGALYATCGECVAIIRARRRLRSA